MPIDMELEQVLRPHQYPMPPYPPKVITSGKWRRWSCVRQSGKMCLPFQVSPPCSFIERDYDIVSARLYGEVGVVSTSRCKRILPDRAD
jgi:hypothetical protein